jgi:hypothetical protein
MWRTIVRRLFVAALSAVLVAGLMGHAALALEMTVKSVAAASTDMEMPMRGGCHGCAGSEKAMTPAACAVFCSSMLALPSAVAVYDVIPIATTPFVAGRQLTGRSFAPDPYPPRPTFLS